MKLQMVYIPAAYYISEYMTVSASWEMIWIVLLIAVMLAVLILAMGRGSAAGAEPKEDFFLMNAQQNQQHTWVHAYQCAVAEHM